MAAPLDYFKLHLIVFIWGFTAILGALISIPSVEMVFLRTLLAAAGMGLFMLATGKRFDAGGGDAVKLLFTGFIVAIHWIAFFASARVSNVSVSLVGFSTASLWTSFIEPLAYKRKVKGIEVLLACAVIGGLYIVFTFSFHFRTGLLLGILAGFTSSVFAVINSKMVKRVSAYSITFFEMTGATLGILLFFPMYLSTWSARGTLSLSLTYADWFYLLMLALVCTVYAYAASVELMKRLSVFFIQLTVNLEPLYGFLLAVLIFGEKEKMHANFYIGSAVILSAVVAYPFLKKRFTKANQTDKMPLQNV